MYDAQYKTSIRDQDKLYLVIRRGVVNWFGNVAVDIVADARMVLNLIGVASNAVAVAVPAAIAVGIVVERRKKISMYLPWGTVTVVCTGPGMIVVVVAIAVGDVAAVAAAEVVVGAVVADLVAAAVVVVVVHGVAVVHDVVVAHDVAVAQDAVAAHDVVDVDDGTSGHDGHTARSSMSSAAATRHRPPFPT